MNSYHPAAAPPEDIHHQTDAVHEWRVVQLTRIGLAQPVAEAVADTVDWHDVANLVRRGCPAALAVTIVG